jgi:hypothetical protein
VGEEYDLDPASGTDLVLDNGRQEELIIMVGKQHQNITAHTASPRSPFCRGEIGLT